MTVAKSFLDTANAKLTSLKKKAETVQRQIDIQLQAYALVPKGVESNETILYYRRERERVSTKKDTEISALEAKIKAVEAKKQAAIDKFDADIEALEAKKEALSEKLTTEEERYVSEIQRFTSKLEDPEPPTAAFRKLKADLTQSLKELEEGEKEFQEATARVVLKNERETKEQQIAYRKVLQEQAMKEADERERFEKVTAMKQQKEMEAFKEAEERCKKLRKTPTEQVINQDEYALKAIENAYPRKVPRIEKKGRKLEWKDLNTNSAYSTSDLSTLVVDADEQSDYELELYEKLWKDACIREKRDGWWSEDK